MNISDLITEKHGFTRTFAKEMTRAKNNRLKLGDFDMLEWANSECLRICKVKRDGSLEDGAACEECEMCEISYIYLAIIKLGMIEEVLRKAVKKNDSSD
jgi:hypothetical protein